MKILLIDIDSKIPNLALMQISAWHKQQGDEIGFNVEDPDRIYASCVFKKNSWKARNLKWIHPDTEILIGGSGISYDWLPEEMQKIKPDYDLYPEMDYSLGFTSRGCIRKCQFCIVSEKEGKYHHWQHPSEFHDGQKKMMILDNNWYADKEWFMETSQWIIVNDIKIREHGMDIRIITPEIAKQLSRLRYWKGKGIHFAFDNMKDEDAVRKGIDILKDAGISLRNDIHFYVLVGYNTTEEEDKYRCRLLKELGTNAFVMAYKRTKWTKKIAWWANRKQAFWSFDIDELDWSKC